jgi:hypothetical protein
LFVEYSQISMMPAAIETAFALGLVVPWELLYRADGNRITTFLTAAQECPLLAQTDITTVLKDVCFWGLSRHRDCAAECPLMTQSGHCYAPF